MFYYYYKDLWLSFFEKLGLEVVISPKTNKQIITNGSLIANDEMCLSFKNYFGHIDYLKDKCDYILVPRIANYNLNNQMCPNFLSFYDLIKNNFKIKILNYNIEFTKRDTLKKAFYKMGFILGYKKKEIKKAYIYALIKYKKNLKKKSHRSFQKLFSNKLKILIVGYPYNVFDEYIGKPVLNYLNKLGIEWISASEFEPSITNKRASFFSKDLYWKYSRELVGAVQLCLDKIDGVIFLSTFPCGTDALVNELLIRKINKPYLNLIIDELDGLAGIETRIESFVDLLE